ncbi:hypothetical protein HMPREF1212_03034 [Parabacteroides sp. HGS0025]|uniref:glycosyltransferase family 52 n=1 Tax=Parabacteroides sp. HGS0025 TaxID=1078087 RepID=UPI0006177A62|nr:glycosyltransferase family 52 [Parabacteroides sp. HGS0025]KKB49875.1 hypothetical protein HMPREF1212_03034 [Parabacteroides sp. HGS0025]
MNLLDRYKTIVYLPNPYALLQYYLLAPCKEEETLFFFHEKFPVSIVQRISGAKILSEKRKFRCASLLTIYWFALRNRNLPVYLGGWLHFTNLFIRLFKHLFYLEDGTLSYEAVTEPEYQVTKKEKVRWRRWMYGDTYPPFGLADGVECIYLTGILPIPDIILPKTKVIDLKSLWQRKSPTKKKKILDVFMFEENTLELMKACDTLLLTQPFSEYSLVFTESDKIEVYRRLLAGQDESKVLIKVHPYEKTDYSVYFPSAQILNTPCPLELLLLQEITLHKVITVNSTAVFSLGDGIEKVISGYDVTPALIEEAKRRNIYNGISNKQVTR